MPCKLYHNKLCELAFNSRPKETNSVYPKSDCLVNDSDNVK